ncbi:YndM family protein [Metabacillus halosaccharovorans]|uniref:YndM family protein n=1 Tax=Metabacillus halosaccharovorans TaxID=930124 RepID=A0ABT3DFY9_9BACI|nr:YndM family protein [Metabacillus halosaccharovorans]MCV9885887.1 YndM family protein [Metabacillus halosaccharovorans]
MNHIQAFLIKAGATFLLLMIILGLLFRYSVGDVFILTLIIGVVSYLLGDLMLLPRTTNMTATFSDFAITMLITWFYLANITTSTTNVFLASLLTALGVALFEMFFHRYMINHTLHQKDEFERLGHLRYNTEISEEITPDRSKIRDQE